MANPAIRQTTNLPGPDQEAAFNTIRDQAYRTGETFTLASGRTSSVYFNMKRAMLNPIGSYHLPLLLLHKLQRINCDAIGGLEMGAVPMISSAATIAYQYDLELAAFFIRKEAKKHGTRQLVEGLDIEDLRSRQIAIVDDVTTTGGSALVAVSLLKQFDIKVTQAITLVDREEGATEAFAEAGVELHALFRKSQFAGTLA